MKLTCPDCKSETFDLLMMATDIQFSADGMSLSFKCLDEEINREGGFVCVECGYSADREFEGVWEFKATLTEEYKKFLEKNRLRKVEAVQA